MSTIITLAALWILRYPIVIFAYLIFSAITWPFRMIGRLIGLLSDDLVCWLILVSLGGIGVYLIS